MQTLHVFHNYVCWHRKPKQSSSNENSNTRNRTPSGPIIIKFHYSHRIIIFFCAHAALHIVPRNGLPMPIHLHPTLAPQHRAHRQFAHQSARLFFNSLPHISAPSRNSNWIVRNISVDWKLAVSLVESIWTLNRNECRIYLVLWYFSAAERISFGSCACVALRKTKKRWKSHRIQLNSFCSVAFRKSNVVAVDWLPRRYILWWKPPPHGDVSLRFDCHLCECHYFSRRTCTQFNNEPFIRRPFLNNGIIKLGNGHMRAADECKQWSAKICECGTDRFIGAVRLEKSKWRVKALRSAYHDSLRMCQWIQCGRMDGCVWL